MNRLFNKKYRVVTKMNGLGTRFYRIEILNGLIWQSDYGTFRSKEEAISIIEGLKSTAINEKEMTLDTEEI